MKVLKTLFIVLACMCAFFITFSAHAGDHPEHPAKTAAKKVVPADVEKSALSGVININTATQEQLELLPGIGAKTALAIIEYRKQNGSFKKVEDIVNVKGIGEKTLEVLKAYLAVSGKTTLT